MKKEIISVIKDSIPTAGRIASRMGTDWEERLLILETIASEHMTDEQLDYAHDQMGMPFADCSPREFNAWLEQHGIYF